MPCQKLQVVISPESQPPKPSMVHSVVIRTYESPHSMHRAPPRIMKSIGNWTPNILLSTSSSLARILHLEAVVLNRTSGPHPFSTLLAHTYSDKIRPSLELIHYGPEAHGLSALDFTALDLAETSTGAFKAQRPLHWSVPLTQDPLRRQGSSKFRMPSDICNALVSFQELVTSSTGVSSCI